MIDSIGTIIIKISNISKSIPIQIQKSPHFFPLSLKTINCTKSK